MRKMISFSWFFFSSLHTCSLSWSGVKALKRTQKLSRNCGVWWTRKAPGQGFKQPKSTVESTASWEEGSPQGTATASSQASTLHLEMRMCFSQDFSLLQMVPEMFGAEVISPKSQLLASLHVSVMAGIAWHVWSWPAKTGLGLENICSSCGGSYTRLLPGPGHLISF